ncbi:MAG: ABC transporter permease [Nanoarchaeota archaeon]|nr:ABC transporter permease [Nanoarchaeota archaeon]
MIKDYFIIAIRNLKKRKLRTWLTMIGIFVSIATIFMLVSLSLGLQNAVQEQFETLGADKFFVQPATGFLGPPGSVDLVILTEKDTDTIRGVGGVKDVMSTVAGNAKVEFNDKIRYMMVWGMSTKTNLFIDVGGYEIDEGRFLEDGDSGINIGILHREGNLWGKPVETGDRLLINGGEFKVRGIISEIGNPEDDRMIIMDLERFRNFFDIPERVDWIVVQADAGSDVKEVAKRVELKLMDARGVTEKTKDFSVLTPEELLGSFQSILNIVTAFLAGIAAISLLVGGIGIANTMYTSVIERTKEIGTMKSIGAQNKDILLIFLIESGMLGFVGGVIGVLLGIGASNIISSIATNALGSDLLQAVAPLWLILGCLGFGFVVGALSGVLPARQASKTNVVDALRYE